MNLGISFFITSIMFGAGLAMDAFSVSLANGLNEPTMKKSRMCGVAGIFSVFQFAMPMIGWICVSTVARLFGAFEKFIPWIALILLGYIGGKMLYEGIKCKETEDEKTTVGLKGLLVQGIATSIDALSVGFTISNYHLLEALCACMLIGIVTFFICYIGLGIGKKAGTKLAGKAGVLGGVILILIGLEIFITSFI
jgi:putative Mn2+ efflux pump MntP